MVLAHVAQICVIASPLIIVGGLGYGTYKIGELAGKGVISGVESVQDSIEESKRAKQITPESVVALVRSFILLIGFSCLRMALAIRLPSILPNIIIMTL